MVLFPNSIVLMIIITIIVSIYLYHLLIHFCFVLLVFCFISWSSFFPVYSHAKRLRLVNPFVYLFVCFVCFLCLNPEVVSWKCCMKNCVLKSFAKFSGKHLCQSPFFNKAAGHSLLRIPFLQNTSCSGDCFWKS